MNKEKKIIEALSIKVLLTSALFIIAIFVFAFLADGVVLGKQRAVDNNIFLFFDSFSTPFLIKAMTLFSFFGSVNFMIPAYVVLISYFILKRNYRTAVDIGIIGLSSTAMIFGLKNLFHRTRPDLPIIKGLHTYSFPSGHALSSFILASILIVIIKHSNWKNSIKVITSVLIFSFAILIGISRIFLHMHYPTDVIASFCLGVVWVIVCAWIFRKIDRQYFVRENFSTI